MRNEVWKGFSLSGWQLLNTSPAVTQGNMKPQASVSTRNFMVCHLVKLFGAPQVGSGEGSLQRTQPCSDGEQLPSSCCSRPPCPPVLALAVGKGLR